MTNSRLALIVMAVLGIGWAGAQEIAWTPGAPSASEIASTLNGSNMVPFSAMNQIPANSIGGNPTGSTGTIAAISMPSCSSAQSALQWTTSSGIGCNSSIDAATVNGATFASPGPIGSGTPSTGAFTTLTVNGTQIKPALSGTTGAIGGGLLSAATCTSGTANVPGASVGMVTAATPNTYPGDGAQFQSYVSSANTVTVKVCALLLLTPVSTTYNVRVIQ